MLARLSEFWGSLEGFKRLLRGLGETLGFGEMGLLWVVVLMMVLGRRTWLLSESGDDESGEDLEENAKGCWSLGGEKGEVGVLVE